jgi:membrane protein implicated in regulation of membrane protease activity
LDFTASTSWWLACGALVAAEMASGTFYLLMVALGCAAGALAAHAGLGMAAQFLVAAVLGAGATMAWHMKRLRGPKPQPAASNTDVNLDIGQRLSVPAWAEDGSARVHYRGSLWTVRCAGHGQPAPGEHVIVAMNGNELRVAPAFPA